MRTRVAWQRTLVNPGRSTGKKQPRTEDWFLEVLVIIYFLINSFFPFAQAKSSHLMSLEIEGQLECLAHSEIRYLLRE